MEIDTSGCEVTSYLNKKIKLKMGKQSMLIVEIILLCVISVLSWVLLWATDRSVFVNCPVYLLIQQHSFLVSTMPDTELDASGAEV